MPLSRDEIFSKVKAILVDALGVDDDDVTPTATLRGDLGAESIDFLDIVFRLEKAFSIKIPQSELFPSDVLTNAQYVQNNRVTPEGLKLLKERMPHWDSAEFEKNPDINNLHFTVDTVVNYIQTKLNAQ